MKRSIAGFSPGRYALPMALAMTLAVSLPAHSQDKPFPGLADVLPELKKGGLVVYFRHSKTEVSDVSDRDMSSCDKQRNLSPEGRDLAVSIGRSIRDLKIPIGAVSTSPYCRCVDTAKLAFGAAKVDPDLSFAMETSPEVTRQLAEALRVMLSTAPARGTNKFIVAHTANLREAARLWPKPEGAAFVFRPLGDGRFEPIARVAPEEWGQLAHPKIAKH